MKPCLRTPSSRRDFLGRSLALGAGAMMVGSDVIVTTERLFAVLVPAEDMNLTCFHPSLDRNLVASWWIQDTVCYVDVGGNPRAGIRLKDLAYQQAPWNDHRAAVWDAHTETCLIQQRESVAGVSCSHVAKAVHDHQVKSGMRKYVYHRPAQLHASPWGISAPSTRTCSSATSPGSTTPRAASATTIPTVFR